MVAIGHTRAGAFHQNLPFVNTFERDGAGLRDIWDGHGGDRTCAAAGERGRFAVVGRRPDPGQYGYGVAADLDGRPLMTPVGNTPASSVDGMGDVLTRGGRTAAKMAMSFGLSGAACLVLSAILLAYHKLLP
jgi:hypothetical protein